MRKSPSSKTEAGMNNESKNNIIKDYDIPIIKISDPYSYVSETKVIAIIEIEGTNGERKGKFMRTKKGGYMFC